MSIVLNLSQDSNCIKYNFLGNNIDIQLCFLNIKNMNNLKNSVIFTHAFPLARVAQAAGLGGCKIPRSQQQYQIVFLDPQQDGTKQGRSCSYSTWSTENLVIAFLWV